MSTDTARTAARASRGGRHRRAQVLAEQLLGAALTEMDQGDVRPLGSEAAVRYQTMSLIASATTTIRSYAVEGTLLGAVPHQDDLPQPAPYRQPILHRIVADDSALNHGVHARDLVMHADRPDVHARTVPHLPFAMVIADTHCAVVSWRVTEDRDPQATFIGRSLLLDVLADGFECLWNLGEPVGASERATAEGAAELTPEDREILVLLSLGATDQTIGRNLHISVRTVQRRIAELSGRLKAQTRFQAGLKAAKRGWI